MRRPTLFRTKRAMLVIAVGIAFTIAGCGPGGNGKTAEVSPEAQKKTEDMLNNMYKHMKEKHKGEGKTKSVRKGP